MSISVETFPTLSQAAAAMGDDAAYLGGGTMVVRGLNFATPDYHRVLRTTDASLKEIRSEGGGIRIGSSVTMAQIMQSRDAEFLGPVARSVGGPAVRNMATVGGNLFVRSPYGDLGVALLALDATVLMSDGQSLTIEDFFARRSSLRGLVAAVLVPRPQHGAFRYKKVCRTRPKGASVLSIAVNLPGGGRISNARVAFGAMGNTPLRAKGAESALEGASLDPSGVQNAVAACLAGLSPQDDSLATGWYRREVAPVHLRRLLLGEES